MASNTYRRDTATQRNVLYVRVVKQGRKSLPDDMRRNCRVIGSVKQTTRDKLDAVISGTLTESVILESALIQWLDQYAINCTVNCSIQ